MKDLFLTTITENVKTLRQGKNLSLEKASKLCDISKSMFAQIERCEVNPTITTLGKIANGFNVTIAELIYKPKPEIQFYPRVELTNIPSFDNTILTLKLLNFDASRRFEHNLIEIDANAKSDINSSPKGTSTYITNFKGSIRITLADKTYDLSSGDMISLQSDINYSFFNPGKKTCRLSVIIHYPMDYIT